MRKVELQMDKLPDKRELVEKLYPELQSGSQDPRSLFYERVLNRPAIRWDRIILQLLLPANSFCG